jgi:hypothetical protein
MSLPGMYWYEADVVSDHMSLVGSFDTWTTTSLYTRVSAWELLNTGWDSEPCEKRSTYFTQETRTQTPTSKVFSPLHGEFKQDHDESIWHGLGHMNTKWLWSNNQKRKQFREYKKISCHPHIGFQVQTSNQQNCGKIFQWCKVPPSWGGWVGPRNAKDQLKIVHYW